MSLSVTVVGGGVLLVEIGVALSFSEGVSLSVTVTVVAGGGAILASSGPTEVGQV